MCMITKSTYEMHATSLIANACYFALLPVAPPAAFGEISPVSRRIGKGSNGSTSPVRHTSREWRLFAHSGRLESTFSGHRGSRRRTSQLGGNLPLRDAGSEFCVTYSLAMLAPSAPSPPRPRPSRASTRRPRRRGSRRVCRSHSFLRHPRLAKSVNVYGRIRNIR